MSNARMDEEQHDRAEDYLHIAERMARSLCWHGNYDDALSAAYWGLIQASLHWRPGSGSFASWASLCIQRNIYRELRRGRLGHRRVTGPPYTHATDPEDLYWVEDHHGGPEYLAELSEMAKLLEILPEEDQVFVQRRLDGVTFTQLAREAGVSRETQRLRWRRLMNQLQTQLGA
jgi:RNA polymerase sigma factor (sigma-70 family)